MSTRYFLLINNCRHCGRHERIHLGLSAAGWIFQFHGYRPDPDEYAMRQDDWPESVDLNVHLDSRHAWIKWLLSFPETVMLTNSYGDNLGEAVPWIYRLERPTPEEIEQDAKKRADALAHTRYKPEPGTRWRDDEGFPFASGGWE